MSKQSVSLSISTDSSQALSAIYAVTDALDALRVTAQKTTEALREAFSALKSALSDSRSGVSGMSSELSKVAKASNSSRSASASASSSSSSAAASPSGGMSAAGVALAAGFAALAAAAVKAADAVKDFAVDAFKSAARVQSITAKTDALLSSRGQSDKAADLYKQATHFAEGTGLADPAAIMERMSDLMVAGVQDAGRALDAVMASLKAGLGDAARSAAAYSALQRTAATGSLDSRSVKSLANSGIDITSALQEVLQVDADALKDLLSTGALGFDTLSAALQQFNRTNEAASEALTGTWDSAFAQLETVWGNIKEDLFMGVVESLTPALQQLKAMLQDNREAFVSLSDKLKSAADYALSLAVGAVNLGKSLAEMLAPLGSAIKKYILDPLAELGLVTRELWDVEDENTRLANQLSGYEDPSKKEAEQHAAESAAATASAAAAEKANADKILADNAAAKAAEAKAKADQAAAAAAEKAAASAEKLAAANRDYQYRHDIQQAQLSGDSYRARELELMRQVEQLSESMQQQGLDKATADARAAELTANEEELRRQREQQAAGSNSFNPPTVDISQMQDIMRISQTSGTAQWRVLSSPMEKSNKLLTSISTTADKILSKLAARSSSSSSQAVLA